MKVPGSERSWQRILLRTKVPGNERSKERKFQEAIVPGNYQGLIGTLVWPKTRPGPLALNAAQPGLKRGPAAHTVLRNRNATSHATSKRRLPPGLVYCSLVLGSVLEHTSIHDDILSRSIVK